MAEGLWRSVLERFFGQQALDEIIKVGVDRVLDQAAASPDPNLRKIFEKADSGPLALLKAVRNAEDYCEIQAGKHAAVAKHHQEQVDTMFLEARGAKGVSRDMLKEEILRIRGKIEHAKGLRHTWGRGSTYWGSFLFRLELLVAGSTVPESAADILGELGEESRDRQEELESALAAAEGSSRLMNYTPEEKAKLDDIEAELQAAQGQGPGAGERPLRSSGQSRDANPETS